MTELEAWVDRVTRAMVAERERAAHAGMVSLATYDASEGGPRYQEGTAAAAALLERELRDLVPDPDALQGLLKWQAERAEALSLVTRAQAAAGLTCIDCGGVHDGIKCP